MQPMRKRLLAGLAVFLFMLAVVASVAALSLAGEPEGVLAAGLSRTDWSS